VEVGINPRFKIFEPKDYVCLQQIIFITLDVTNNYVFLRVKKVLPSRVLLLKGQDGQICKDCRNLIATLALGSQLRQKGLQGCGPRESPGVTSHTPGSVGK